MNCSAYRRANSFSGFTLMELSIVLVIIALIAGGVMVGRDLLAAAEVRKVLTNIDKVNAAVMTFKTKYNCLPGDCQNIDQFIVGETNGNGNGRIGVLVHTTNSGDSWWLREQYTFWRHLAAAGLIEGTYTGLQGPLGWAHAIPGVNVYALGVRDMAIETVFVGDTFTFWPAWSNGLQGVNVHQIGSGGVYAAYNPVFTPAEAYAIDLKSDDGYPRAGKVVASIGWGATVDYSCITGDQSYGGWPLEYFVVPNYSHTWKLTQGKIGCTLLVQAPF